VGTDELQAPGDSMIKKLKASAKATPAAAAGKKPPLPDVSEIDLPSHNVFINPKEVRAEITALKTRYKCTNADLANAVWPEKTASTSQPGALVGRFRQQSGDFGGSESDFYQPCALFLERLRIYENRPKTKKRKAIELESEETGRAPFLGLNTNKKYIVPEGVCAKKYHLERAVFDLSGW